MSNNQVWLVVALVGTFMTIFMLGLVVDMALSARRRYETVRRVERVPDHQGVADEEHDRLVPVEQHA